jgi:site-specific DNA-cytosine methylase
MAKQKRKALGVYIYAGGFTHGVAEHFDIMGHFEDPKPYASWTAETNLGVDVFPHPWPVQELGHEADMPELIYCNPPCAAFSGMGQMIRSGKGRDAWRGSPYLQCTENVFNLLQTGVKILAWESVLNSLHLAYELMGQYAQRANELGYHFTMVPHNAYFMGSCQKRIRVMYICHKIEWYTAEPDFERTETVRDRLAQLDGMDLTELPAVPALHNRLGWLLPWSNEGEQLTKAFDRAMDGQERVYNERGHVKGRPALAGPVRLSWDKPCPTVTGHIFVHPDGERFCALEEMSILADYPIGWKWPATGGNTNEMARGVSRFVGQWLGESAAYSLDQDEALAQDPGVTLIDLRYPANGRPDLDHYLKARKIDPSIFYGA